MIDSSSNAHFHLLISWDQKQIADHHLSSVWWERQQMIEFHRFSNISINGNSNSAEQTQIWWYCFKFPWCHFFCSDSLGWSSFPCAFPCFFQNLSEISLFLCHSLPLIYFFLSGGRFIMLTDLHKIYFQAHCLNWTTLLYYSFKNYPYLALYI